VGVEKANIMGRKPSVEEGMGRRRLFIFASPQEFVKEPDAGATGYFVETFKTFVNCSFHASAKKTSMSQNRI
jgi:hypothetical protein